MSPSSGAPGLGLTTLKECGGRALLLDPDGTLYIGRNYEIFASSDKGENWSRVGLLPLSPFRRATQWSRLACRLIRHEVRALAHHPDGTFIAANREGVFYGHHGDRPFARSHFVVGELPLMPPMRITVGPDGVVLFGEYGSGGGRPVRIFASRDSGRNFEPVHSLAKGEVLHIHNLIYDEGLDHYWVLAGDHDKEPGIGQLSADLQHFSWFVKGEQRFRAVELFDFGDRLVYPTDTEREKNGLIVLDKKTGQTERLRDFEGSCIYACRFGSLFAMTTSVEPSPVNESRSACLLLSRDAEHWDCALRAEKDSWNADYFQFGSIVLPVGHGSNETILYSGQALREIDGRVRVSTASGLY